MGMTVGELVGYIDLEDKGFASELQAAERSLDKLQSATSSKTASIESTVTKTFTEVEKAIADGLDPTSAIADLDRLEKELDAGLAAMLAEADSFGAELEAEIDKAFASLDDEAKESGRKAGEELVDGLDDGLKDAPSTAREHGRKAGEEFGDGVESGGGGKGGGGRMSGIGANLIGGLKAGAVGLAVGVGAAIGDKLIEGIQTAMERADLFATLSVKVGAFGAESERLGDVAGELYADAYGESLGDVTDALAKVLQNIDGAGRASDDVLKGMTSQAMVVGKAMDEDVGAVTRAVSQILRNDLAPNAQAAFDILVRGQQEGVNKSEDLLDTFNEYSTIFRDLGLSGKDALGLMSQGLKAGARDSDTVADALKELDIRVKDLSAAKALKSLGLDAKEMAAAFAKGGPKAREALGQILEKLGKVEDPAKRAQLAVSLFGTKAEDMAGSINSLNLDTATSSVGNFAGAVKTADKTLGDTASSSADKWSRSWDNTFAWLGEQAMSQIQQAIPSPADMGEQWDALKSWFNSEVWPSLVNGWTTISDTTAEIWTGIGDWLGAKTSEIADWVGQLPGKIGEYFSSGWESLRSDTAAHWEGIKAAATEKADAAVEWLKAVPGRVGGFFASGWESLKTDTAAKWEGIKAAATGKADDLVVWLKGVPDKVKAVFAAAGTWLLQAGRDVVQGLVNGIKAKVNDAVSAVTGVGQRVVDAAKNVFDQHSPSKVFAGIGEMVTKGLADGINAVKGLATDAIHAVTTDVIGAAHTGTGTGTGGGTGGSPSAPMAEIGKLTVQGLIKGLTEEGANVKTVIDKITEDIKSAFKAKPDVVDGLLDFVRVGNKNLEDLALQRQALVQQLADAKEMAKKVAGTAEEWAAITGLKPEDFTGAGDMAAELGSKAHAINDFANNIQALAKRGLNKKIIQDLIDAGVEKGGTFAEMLVGSDGSEIKALNKAQAAVDKASKKLGKSSADAMYDVGKKSGEGYLTGLQESLKSLDKEMKKIVDALVKAIKKELKIKSPSQVMAEVGQYTMQGFVDGMQAMTSAVQAGAQMVVSKAVAGAQAVAGGNPLVSSGSLGTFAASIGRQGATASLGMDSSKPAAPVGQQPGGQGVNVHIDMSGSTVNKEADIPKIGSTVAFNVMARPF